MSYIYCTNYPSASPPHEDVPCTQKYSPSAFSASDNTYCIMMKTIRAS